LIIQLICLFSVSFFTVPAGAETSLTIYYTASLNGNLDGCNCPMNPVAGLVKRAAFLRTLRSSGSTLILDAGDVLDEYPDPDLAEHILEVYEELNYNAVAVGDQELANGAEALLEYRAYSPLICHNLLIQNRPSDDGASESLLFTPDPVVIARKGLLIGILSLIDPAALPEPSERGMRIVDPITSASTILTHCDQADLDLTILLYHGCFQSALELVNACPCVDVVIFAHEQQLVAPRKIGTTIFASPGEEGNRLGILTLYLGPRGIDRFENEFRFFSYTKDPDDPAVRSRIDSYRHKLRARLY